MKKLTILALVCALLFGCVAQAEIVNTDPTEPVYTALEYGTIGGYKYDSVYHFLGVPYGQAERFKMAEQPTAWEGVRWTTVYGYVAPTNKVATNSAEFLTTSNFDFIENEDCLNLNVWTKSMDADAKKPVLVWLHGGGYSSGSSVELVSYDGHNLTRDGDIVFVSLNHRLNVLGFLDLSAYGEEYKYSGNVGMADIVLALEWVRDNIEQFGGDPANVTIIGQSGGGGKVLTLMGMPAAQGLFQKAICMSGGAGGQEQAVAQEAAAKLLEILEISPSEVEKLQDVPYTELLAASREAKVSSSPVVDGDYYPVRSIDADGNFAIEGNDVPLIVGMVISEFTSNGFFSLGTYTDEATIASRYKPGVSEEQTQAVISERFGDKAEAVIAAYEAAYPGKDLFYLPYVANRTNVIATAKASQGGANVYQYVNAWEYPTFGGMTTGHSMDFAFFFRNVEKIPYQIAGKEIEAYAMQDFVSGALLSFMYNGVPDSNGTTWTPFTVEEGATMIFDDAPEIRNYHDREFMALISQ